MKNFQMMKKVKQKMKKLKQKISMKTMKLELQETERSAKVSWKLLVVAKRKELQTQA